MTNTNVSRHAAFSAVAIVCAVTCAALAGCSSGPSPSQQAQASRAPVLSAAKDVYHDVYDAHIGWSGTIIGGISLCGTYDVLATGKGSDFLQYATTQEFTPLARGVGQAKFGQQVIQKLDGEGWHLRSAPAPNPAHPIPTYAGQHDGLTLQLTEFQDPGFGPTVTIDVNANCFNAGSSALQIMRKDVNEDQINEPRPSSTP
jgi:hypothetical protein